jgi:hypothetical protein
MRFYWTTNQPKADRGVSAASQKDEPAVISAVDAAGLCDAVFVCGFVSTRAWVLAETQEPGLHSLKATL